MSSPLRTDIWCGAFVRRHNDLGHMCVVSRKGDAVAGQVFVEVDHLNGTVSLYTPAPAIKRVDDTAERLFERRLDRVEPARVRERIEREAKYDPDLWVLTVDLRDEDPGLVLVR